MGDAQILRRGGNTFRGVQMISPPAKTSYYAGEYADLTGMIIAADFGTFTIPLSRTAYTCAPAGVVTASDTEITITANISGKPESVSIPISVNPINPVFGNNPWASIAYAAEHGIAGDYWNVGDTKTVNGIAYTIIGMDHDDLSQTDEKYNDASYNRNTKRAALTIQIMTQGQAAQMNTTASNSGGWHESHMRNAIIPAYFEEMPHDIRAVMRTVNKVTASRGGSVSNPAPLVTSADKLFLLSSSEAFNQSGASPEEARACRHYAYYTNDDTIYRGFNEWLRSPAWGTFDEAEQKDFSSIGLSTQTGLSNEWCKWASISLYYLPAFCI